MNALQVLPVNSVPPADWWRRISTTVNTMLGSLTSLYQRETVSVTVDYAASATDYALIVDAGAGAVSVTLPAPTKGRQLAVKRIDASANVVTLIGQVDGGSSLSMSAQWQAYTLLGGGDRWLIV